MVGNIILEQLKVRMNDLFVWGATSFKLINQNQLNDIPHLGGLVFKVSGLKHKKHVMIRLSPNDTYVVEIGTLSNGVWKSKESHSDIYVEDLHETIDAMVEGTLNMSKEEIVKAYENTPILRFS